MRQPNEFNQLRCSHCGLWKHPDKFQDHPHTKCGKASWCKVCTNEASLKCTRQGGIKAHKGTITPGDYFIATVRSNGDILLREDGYPFRCKKKQYQRIYADDGMIEGSNGMKVCKRVFEMSRFTFELTKKGKLQRN